MRVELLPVPDCPNAPAARDLVRACLVQLGLRVELAERVGPYPSPTVLVDGQDVMGGTTLPRGACRLDLPTAERILAAMRTSLGSVDAPTGE